jgi:zinc/manganese transport system permease protein
MFASFMISAWVTATIVAVVAGVVGYFVVLRGSAFAAHAIPKGAFAGAAGASLLGLPTVAGLAVFSALGAVVIGSLGRRGRHEVVTALTLVMMLALGAAFLSQTTQYEPEIYALLFGEILGVSTLQVLPTAVLGAACIAAVAVLYRPLLLSSAVPEVAEARGVRGYRVEILFLLVVALATAATLPVVGALLIFSLMVGPPAAARAVASSPSVALALSAALALLTAWAAIAASYLANWPVGFFVGMLGAVCYGTGRCWAAWRRARPGRPAGRAGTAHGRRAAAGRLPRVPLHQVPARVSCWGPGRDGAARWPARPGTRVDGTEARWRPTGMSWPATSATRRPYGRSSTSCRWCAWPGPAPSTGSPR